MSSAAVAAAAALTAISASNAARMAASAPSHAVPEVPLWLQLVLLVGTVVIAIRMLWLSR